MARLGPRPYAELERIAVRAHWLAVAAVGGTVLVSLICAAGHYPQAAKEVIPLIPKAEAAAP